MSAVAEDALRSAFKSQYGSALAMLRDAVERCPDELWEDNGYTNCFWQIAYHALYFTHLYLQPEEAAFRPWPGHRGQVQHPDGIAGPADPSSALPLLPQPYTRDEVLAYWQTCEAMVDVWGGINSDFEPMTLWRPPEIGSSEEATKESAIFQIGVSPGSFEARSM